MSAKSPPPPTPAKDPVEGIFAVARTQLEILADARARGLAAPALEATTLELLLRAIAGAAHKRAQEPATPEPEREALAALARLVQERAASTVQLSSHLIEMTADWTCAHCGADVAEGATLSSVDKGLAFLRLDVVCASCGERSRPGATGRAVFDARFGHLVKPGWNPEAHGFVWDRRSQ
jgi:hypothetical protein